MPDPTLPLPGLSPVAGKAVVAKFDGGLLSSDGGVLALREVEKRLRVADRFAACIKDSRAPDQITHTLADIIRFRLLMIAAGYEDGNDASDLRRDPRSDGARPCAIGPGAVFAAHDLAFGEPAGRAIPSAHRAGDGRPLLCFLPTGAAADRARHRRHV